MTKPLQDDWHLDRKVGVGHLFATISLVAGGILAYANVTKDISTLQVEFAGLSERVVRVLEAQQRVDDAQDRDLTSFRNEIRADVREINAKLDRLIESRFNGTQ